MIRKTSNGVLNGLKRARHMVLFVGTGIALATAPLQADDGKVDLKPMHVGASLYFGQMFNISDSIMDHQDFKPTVTLPYTYLWMIQEATVGDRLHFTMGLAGSFFYPFPEFNDQAYTSYRTGGFGIAQANGSYNFGDLENPSLILTLGQQGYKYNPYAKNFGEYLFRSEAYPTIVRTGDWGAIDNAGAGVWGASLKGTFLGGLLTNDFFFTMSDTRVPLYDPSVTDLMTIKIGKVLQIGAGLMINRAIQIDPSKSRVEKPTAGWMNWTAGDQQRLTAYVNKYRSVNPNAADPVSPDKYNKFIYDGLAGKKADTTLVVGQKYWAASQRPLVTMLITPDQDTIAAAEKKALLDNLDIDYISARTIFGMGRFSIDPKPLMGLDDALGPLDLVLYGETSVLGFTNYPIYYRSISERMPMMLGFYLPTFKYLDFLTVEAEYMKNPHVNSDFVTGLFRAPVPKSTNGQLPEIPDIADPEYDKGADQNHVNHTQDDFKWTVTAQKSFGVVSLAGQAGKDHFRPLDGYFRPSLTEAATTSDAWYYTIRLLVNL